jgi:membrane protein DedA with SNARE-associated domain
VALAVLVLVALAARVLVGLAAGVRVARTVRVLVGLALPEPVVLVGAGVLAGAGVSPQAASVNSAISATNTSPKYLAGRFIRTSSFYYDTKLHEGS